MIICLAVLLISILVIRDLIAKKGGLNLLGGASGCLGALVACIGCFTLYPLLYAYTAGDSPLSEAGRYEAAQTGAILYGIIFGAPVGAMIGLWLWSRFSKR